MRGAIDHFASGQLYERLWILVSANVNFYQELVCLTFKNFYVCFQQINITSKNIYTCMLFFYVFLKITELTL